MWINAKGNKARVAIFNTGNLEYSLSLKIPLKIKDYRIYIITNYDIVMNIKFLSDE